MLDSTGHVYMTDPRQQEMEIDYFARHDAIRERFAGEADNLEDSWYEHVEDIRPLNRRQRRKLAKSFRKAKAKIALSSSRYGEDDIPF